MRVLVHCSRLTLVGRQAALRATLCLASASSLALQVSRATASVSFAAALVNLRVSATALAPAKLVECFRVLPVNFLAYRPRQLRRPVPSMSAALRILRRACPSRASYLASAIGVIELVRFGYCALEGQVQVQPNMSVNRTRYGKAPRPRGGFGPSSASRPGRLASARRLPLR